MARHVAKNIVGAEFCERCEVELAYAIGVPFPVSVMVDTFGTAKGPEEQTEAAVKKVFDLSPGGIIRTLDLKRPIYQETAAYGHFSRDSFTWERLDKIKELQKAVG